MTSNLDDVIDSNLILRIPQKRRPRKKGEVPDYGIAIDDEVEDMNLGDKFGDYVPPQQEKQLAPAPPIYVHPPEDPPKYDYDEEVDYAIPDEELTTEILNELGLDNYEIIGDNINDTERTYDGNIKYLNDNIKYAKKREAKIERLYDSC